LESIKNQTYRNFEHIIVNDGSSIPLEIPNYPWIKIIDQANLQRLTAYNNGFKAAKGEIFCLLDSDDEYEPNYLEEVDKLYYKFPRFKMFNFGCTHVHSDGVSTQRAAFRPKRKKVGHEVFGGGNIVNGTFVFHRSIYEDLGAFPPHHIENIDCSSLNYGGIRELWMTSPYDFSAAAQLEFPELQKYFMVDHVAEPHKIIKEFGNPWGQDHYLFYKYTRKYHSKPIDKYLYKVNLK